MRKGVLVVSLALWAGLFAVPAGAQSADCNGLTPTMTGRLVYGTAGADVIVGTEEDDRIYAEAGNDTICGLGGDDTIDPGPGDDFLDGGVGSDWILFSEWDAAPIVVDLAVGSASGGEGTDEIVAGSVENVETNCSNDNADTLIGDGDDNTLSGGSGSDTIVAGGGDDLVYGTDPSVDRTDAVCWSPAYEADEDVVDGGDGDDVLLGQIGMDELDGGPGWDIVDGGDDSDLCTRGERYVSCEEQQTPAPPPECSDDTDNDGDGTSDADDPECSHPADPREDVADDPGCNDGRDNDGDGVVDYTADMGCLGLEDETELNGCIGPCPGPYVTIEYKPGRAKFRGRVVAAPSECAVNRLVVLRKKREGTDPKIGRDHTNARGIWEIDRRRPRGRFYVVARRTRVTLSGGEVAPCPRLRSAELKIQGSFATR